MEFRHSCLRGEVYRERTRELRRMRVLLAKLWTGLGGSLICRGDVGAGGFKVALMTKQSSGVESTVDRCRYEFLPSRKYIIFKPRTLEHIIVYTISLFWDIQ